MYVRDKGHAQSSASKNTTLFVEKRGDLCSREKCQRAIKKKRKAQPLHRAPGLAQAVTDTGEGGDGKGQH